MTAIETVEQLEAWLLERAIPEPISGCWLWTGSNASGVYARVRRDGRMQQVTRIVLSIVSGNPMPTHLMACHRCDNPYCVNPAHLFMGTCSDNVRDALRKGRWPVSRGDDHYLRHCPEKAVKGERHGRAKIREHDVLRIRSSDLSASKMAAMLGISKSMVIHIRAGRNWAHVQSSPFASAAQGEGGE